MMQFQNSVLRKLFQHVVFKSNKNPHCLQVSLGLPGGEKVFDSNVFERLVCGETVFEVRRIQAEVTRQKPFIDKGRDGSVNGTG